MSQQKDLRRVIFAESLCVLHPGKDAWPIEFKPNSVMDDDSEEHIIEVAKVLSEYCDLIAVRAFPKFIDLEEDLSDKVINGFAKYASVPVVNMETITHPCQELAHILTMQEELGDLSGKDYLLKCLFSFFMVDFTTPFKLKKYWSV